MTPESRGSAKQVGDGASGGKGSTCRLQGRALESVTVPVGSSQQKRRFHHPVSRHPSSPFLSSSSSSACCLSLPLTFGFVSIFCSAPAATRKALRRPVLAAAAAGKMSTIVMGVDLDCEKCYKKIRKVLCKIQDKVSMRTISYDEKSKTVTISGPFDADEVADRLTSNAGKVITDMHVVGGAGNQKHVFNAPATKPGKQGDGHGHGGYGGGKPEKGHGHGGFGGGGGGHKHEKGLFGFVGGKKEKEHGHGGHGGHGGGGKQDRGHGHGGYGGGGGKQEIKGHGGGGGGKPEKKQVKFDFDDMSDDDDDFDDEPAHAHHGAGHGGKPIITRTTPVAARLDAPRTGPPMSMATAAPMRMPPPGMMSMPQHQQQQPQAMAVPSIWPAPSAAPEWGYSAPQQYGGGGYPAAGGYYGGVPSAAYGYGGYGAPAAYGYGRNPYGAPPQYYEEEPSAGCSIM